MRCAVFGCNSDNQTKREFDRTIKFFRFPVKDPVVCDKWINACSRADKFNVNNARICELHFNKETDYERCLKEELLGYVNKNRRQLKKGVVPSLKRYKNMMDQNDNEQPVPRKKGNTVFILEKSNICNDFSGVGNVNVEKTINLENVHQSSIRSNKTGINIQDPAKKHLIVSDLKSIFIVKRQMQVTGEGSRDGNDKNERTNNTDSLNQTSLLANMSNDNKSPGASNNHINLKYNTELLGKHSETICKSSSQRLFITKRSIATNTEGVSDNQKTISDLKQKNAILEWQTKGLKSIFSPAQIKKINEPLKRPRWSEEDISNSVVLYATGPRLYKLLIGKGYPLPAIATLRFWMKNADIKNLYLKTRVRTGIRKTAKTNSNKRIKNVT